MSKLFFHPCPQNQIVNPVGILSKKRSVAICVCMLLFAVIVIAGSPSNACFAQQVAQVSRVTTSEAGEVESTDLTTSDSSLRPTASLFEQYLVAQEDNQSDYDCHIPDLAEENWESVETREPSPSIITRGFKDHYVERGGRGSALCFQVQRPASHASPSERSTSAPNILRPSYLTQIYPTSPSK